MPEKLKFLLTSRKFWATVVGLLMLVLKTYVPNFPFSEQNVTDFVVLIVAFIVGTAVEDAGKAAAKKV